MKRASATLCCLTCAAVSASTLGTSPSQERFTRFLEKPPIVKKLVFGLRTPVSPLGGVLSYDDRSKHLQIRVTNSTVFPAPRWGIDAEGFRWYLARWQPNGFLLRQIAPEDPGQRREATNVVNNLRSWGNYEDTYWVLEGHTLQLCQSPDGRVGKDTNPVVRSVALGKGLLSKALNLGILDLGIGSVKWHGAEFSENSIAVPGITIRGSLNRIGDRVVSLNLNYDDYPYRVDYYYETNLDESWLPRRFVTSFRGTGQDDPRFEVRIVTLETTDTPLASSYFEPEVQETSVTLRGSLYRLHSGIEQRWCYTNNTILAMGPTGELHEVSQGIDELEFQRRLGKGSWSWLWMTVIMLFFLVPVSAAAATKIKRNKQIERRS